MSYSGREIGNVTLLGQQAAGVARTVLGLAATHDQSASSLTTPRGGKGSFLLV